MGDPEGELVPLVYCIVYSKRDRISMTINDQTFVGSCGKDQYCTSTKEWKL